MGGRTWRGLEERRLSADPGGVRARRGRELKATLYSEALKEGRKEEEDKER